MENKKKFILDVPYYSQYLDVSDENWKPRACGILCLKMVMEFYGRKINREIPAPDHLTRENEFINGFGKFGSEHEPLVMIARNYGFHAYRQEFRSLVNDYESKKIIRSPYEDELTKKGIEKIVRKLENNQPVIVSAVKNFSEIDKFHLVVLTGLEKDGDEIKGFYYHDSGSHDREAGKHKFVPMDIFKKHWRKMAIYVKI